jgi:hypothetical protein
MYRDVEVKRNPGVWSTVPPVDEFNLYRVNGSERVYISRVYWSNWVQYRRWVESPNVLMIGLRPRSTVSIRTRYAGNTGRDVWMRIK